MKLKSRGGEMIRTFLSWIVLTVIYVGAFGLVLSEVFYLVAEINNARSVQLVDQVRAGFGISWNWVRTDNWGIETFFFVTEVFILGGAIWLYQQGKLRTKLTRSSSDRIVANSLQARKTMEQFLKAYDGTNFEGLGNKSWRTGTDKDLGGLYSSLKSEVGALQEKLNHEKVRFSPNSEARGQIKEYAHFVYLVFSVIERFPNHSDPFIEIMNQQKQNLANFAKFKFSFHKQIPRWIPPLPSGAKTTESFSSVEAIMGPAHETQNMLKFRNYAFW